MTDEFGDNKYFHLFKVMENYQRTDVKRNMKKMYGS